MDADTINGATVTLKNAGTGAAVRAAVRRDDPCRKVTIDPSETLAKCIRYAVPIEGGDVGVKTTSGEAMAVDAVWAFTTGRR